MGASEELRSMLRIAVLAKQVPRTDALSIGADGRLVREGLELEMSAFCRRAVSAGVALAAPRSGRVTAVSMGPPSAEEVVREAVAWGADEGVLVTDERLGGSDTLASARVLAAALTRLGPFDLVLCGRNSLDADTGQVGPELAQLLGWPFLGGARELALAERRLRARCEQDDGWLDAETDLPAVVSCAERLCEPAKVGTEGRSKVAAGRLRLCSADDLGTGPWGVAASPTRVGEVRVLEVARAGLVLSGPLAEQVAAAVDVLDDAGALAPHTSRAPDAAGDHGTDGRPDAYVPDGWARGSTTVAVLVEPGRQRCARELLGAGARLASRMGGRVAALATEGLDPWTAGSWGADELVVLTGSDQPFDLGDAMAGWCQSRVPWALLAPSTMWGREIASRTAARLGAGLTGDAVDLSLDGDRLVGWKPAFGGRVVAAVRSDSDVQMATVRPGVIGLLLPRRPVPPAIEAVAVEASHRVETVGAHREDDPTELATATAVVGVGTGVAPEEYPALDPLREALGATMAATRKVADRGWQPRSRQVGVTGRSISPRLYVALGLAGKPNHMIGVRGAGRILGVNADPEAPLHGSSDVSIVADWREAVPLLVETLHRHLGRRAQPVRSTTLPSFPPPANRS